MNIDMNEPNPLLIEKTNKLVLYHYTSANALYSILEKERLWITRSDFLNDYMEKNYFDSIYNEVACEIKTNYPDINLFLELIKKHQTMHKSLNLTQYVLSLTENPDSLVLWSNYSKHDGYNIGFNVLDLNANEVNTGVSGNYIAMEYIIKHGHVIYEIDKQKHIIYQELEDAIQNWKNYSKLSTVEDYNFANDYQVTSITNRLRQYSLFFKHPSFSPEEEYRFIFEPFASIGDKLVEFRVNNGVIVPYIELPLQATLYKEGGKLPLHSITIGPKNNLDTASSGIKAYLQHAKYPDSIRVEKSKIPLRF